jgi:hypothetical protein
MKKLQLDKTTWTLLILLVGPVESFLVFIAGHYIHDLALASAVVALVNTVGGILIWYFNAEESVAPGPPPPSPPSVQTTGTQTTIGPFSLPSYTAYVSANVTYPFGTITTEESA